MIIAQTFDEVWELGRSLFFRSWSYILRAECRPRRFSWALHNDPCLQNLLSLSQWKPFKPTLFTTSSTHTSKGSSFSEIRMSSISGYLSLHPDFDSRQFLNYKSSGKLQLAKCCWAYVFINCSNMVFIWATCASTIVSYLELLFLFILSWWVCRYINSSCFKSFSPFAWSSLANALNCLYSSSHS